MKVNLVAAVCCMVVCMATICAGSVPIVDCRCLKYSTTRIYVTKLRSYTEQQAGPCSISAIRFITELDQVICSDPHLNWTKNAVKYLKAGKVKPAKATTTPIPVTTPQKGGPSPTNLTTKAPVQDRGSSLTIESTPSKPTPNFPGQGSTPTLFVSSSVEKRDTTTSSSSTKSPVQDRGSTSSPPTTPTTMTTRQETPTTTRPVHQDTSPQITRTPIKHTTKRYTPSPINRTPTYHNTKRYTPSPITRTPTNHNTKRYTSTVITRKPINHNTKGYTSTVRRISTVLPTHKLPSWIKRRQNRRNKPGLRRKQKVNKFTRPK